MPYALHRVALGAMPFLLALSACGGLTATTEDPFLGNEGRNEIRIYIRNGNYYDARVSAILEGRGRRQLGMVGGKTEGVFTLPLTFSRDLRLQIDMVAGPTCVTEPLGVDPGDEIQMEILPAPLDSNFCR